MSAGRNLTPEIKKTRRLWNEIKSRETSCRGRSSNNHVPVKNSNGINQTSVDGDRRGGGGRNRSPAARFQLFPRSPRTRRTKINDDQPKKAEQRTTLRQSVSSTDEKVSTILGNFLFSNFKDKRCRWLEPTIIRSGCGRAGSREDGGVQPASKFRPLISFKFAAAGRICATFVAGHWRGRLMSIGSIPPCGCRPKLATKIHFNSNLFKLASDEWNVTRRAAGWPRAAAIKRPHLFPSPRWKCQHLDVSTCSPNYQPRRAPRHNSITSKVAPPKTTKVKIPPPPQKKKKKKRLYFEMETKSLKVCWRLYTPAYKYRMTIVHHTSQDINAAHCPPSSVYTFDFKYLMPTSGKIYSYRCAYVVTLYCQMNCAAVDAHDASSYLSEVALWSIDLIGFVFIFREPARNLLQ